MDEQVIGEPLAGTFGTWLVTMSALIGTAGIVASFSSNLLGPTISIVGMILIIVGSALM